MSYHEGFAAHRQLVQKHLQPAIVVDKFRSIMETEAHVLLGALRARPEEFANSIRRYDPHEYPCIVRDLSGVAWRVR
jgi:hypothetical protein